MGSALAKRVRKLEKTIGQVPCDKPGHQALYVFIDDKPERTAENEARIADIRACPKCKDNLVIRFVRWRCDGEKQPAHNFTFRFPVEDKPDTSLISEPEPFQFKIEPEPAVTMSDWLKDLENE